MIKKNILLQRLSALSGKSEKILKDSKRLEELLKKAASKATAEKNRVSEVKRDFFDLIQLVRDYVSGRYREIPWKSLVMIVATILYFVNPFDVIPDFIAGLGLLDDITLLQLVMRQLRVDVENYRKSVDKPVENSVDKSESET